MGFRFGAGSLKEMTGVHPVLVRVATRALEICEVDFAFHDGLRTEDEQTALVAKGASTTMNSKHRKQADGWGHAMDLVPYINGKLRWEWEPIFKIATAVDQAATELKVKIRWGGVWDKILTEYGGSAEAMEAEVDAYVARRKAKYPGKKVFIDGPHFELVL